ncbi:GspH/FimT family pseudopilin [Caballeronia sp. PC1]|nr:MULTISPECIES: GspH/FimT family pseudopilin [unclassified Caballeronia]MCE4540826.1 GspH/FimT family pseudopilin [Caballeronia sp. PC1]MCE4570131.1 GspH/FimT family pseudopilin [Caballeronia sp. CLC5]
MADPRSGRCARSRAVLHAFARPRRSRAAGCACGWAMFVDRDGVSTLLRMQPSMTSVSIAGTSTELSFTPPSGQVIGGFRSFDFAPRSADAAANPASRRCVRLAAGGRARMSQGACGAST